MAKNQITNPNVRVINVLVTKKVATNALVTNVLVTNVLITKCPGDPGTRTIETVL